LGPNGFFTATVGTKTVGAILPHYVVAPPTVLVTAIQILVTIGTFFSKRKTYIFKLAFRIAISK